MLKYIFDRITALIGLIILFPLLVLIAILIAIKMPDGPVLFCQKRVGKDGKLFTIYKFRTMSVGIITSSIAALEQKRVTPLGIFLRKWHLDELPQLWNILKADMSFVGPRPDVPGYADNLEGEDRLILKLRPGLTGPATIKFSNEEQILSQVKDPEKYNKTVIYPEKTRINLDYYYHHTLLGDLKLIIRSIFGSV